MNLFLLALLCDLLVPVIMLIAGAAMHRSPPKHINSWAGYRTARSMESPATWKFANETCSALWCKVGKIMLVLTLLLHLPFLRAKASALSALIILTETVQVVVLLLTIPYVEKRLKEAFPHEDETHHP